MAQCCSKDWWRRHSRIAWRRRQRRRCPLPLVFGTAAWHRYGGSWRLSWIGGRAAAALAVVPGCDPLSELCAAPILAIKKRLQLAASKLEPVAITAHSSNTCTLLQLQKQHIPAATNCKQLPRSASTKPVLKGHGLSLWQTSPSLLTA